MLQYYLCNFKFMRVLVIFPSLHKHLLLNKNDDKKFKYKKRI